MELGGAHVYAIRKVRNKNRGALIHSLRHDLTLHTLLHCDVQYWLVMPPFVKCGMGQHDQSFYFPMDCEIGPLFSRNGSIFRIVN